MSPNRPAIVSVSSEAVPELERSFDEMTSRLSLQVQSMLGGDDLRWNFRRRNGVRHTELIATADEVRERADADADADADATIAIVVGNDNRIISSVPAALVRHSPYALVVVPSGSDIGYRGETA